MLDETGKEIDIGVSDEERSKRRAVLDKTTGKDLENKWREEDRQEIELREKRMAPPVFVEPRCKVCTSQWRAFIEQQLVKGQASYEKLANMIPPDEDGNKIGRKSIANHAKEHLPLDRAVIRAELEEQADILKQNYETGVKGALTLRGMLNVIVNKAYDDHMKGMTTTEIKDLIQLVKLMNEMNNSEGTVKTEETEAALRIFVRAIQNVCPAEVQVQIAAESKRLRQLDDLDFQAELYFEQPGLKALAIDTTAEDDNGETNL
jgi:hypothetical protein